MDGTHFPNNKHRNVINVQAGWQGRRPVLLATPQFAQRCGHATPPDKRREGGRNGDAGAHDARHTPEQSHRQVTRQGQAQAGVGEVA